MDHQCIIYIGEINLVIKNAGVTIGISVPVRGVIDYVGIFGERIHHKLGELPGFLILLIDNAVDGGNRAGIQGAAASHTVTGNNQHLGIVPGGDGIADPFIGQN